ncbi:Zinc finger BED domain-containing protein RICESLEEPER 1 [Linum perenne]
MKVNEALKDRCKYCRKYLSGDSNSGTSHLRNHNRTCIRKKIHDGQQKVLGPNFLHKGKAPSSYPTANMFFSKACDHRLELMNWHDDSNSVISEMARTMWLQFTKYWDDIHLVLAVAVVLDPRYKLHLIGYYATKLGITNSYLVGDSVKKIVCDLVLAYQTKYSSQVVSSYCSTTSATDLDFELFMSQRKRLRTTLVTTELDHYLAEQIIPRTLDFDILLWWKLNGAKYPTLQQIARDFLAIPTDANRLLQEGIDSTPKTIYQPPRIQRT